MTNHIYAIHCVSNLHVGSGETIGIIDKTVQRDPITDRPIIHGSSLKGALREYFENKEPITPPFVQAVFGSDIQSSPQGTTAGLFHFFSAHLISMPLRSDKQPYFNVTCPGAIQYLLKLADSLKIILTKKEALVDFAKLNPGTEAIVFDPEANNGRIEDFVSRHQPFANIEDIKIIVGDFPALIGDKNFSEISKNEIPVIARNCLDNGKSTNLWYEEIVPRESRFVFGLIGDSKYDSQFETTLSASLVQIGGNATVGYGFTKIQKLA
jgi:CRISPR-associated protein Cmr4